MLRISPWHLHPLACDIQGVKTHARTHTHTHTHTHAHAHTHTRAHTHTHTLTHSPSHTHTTHHSLPISTSLHRQGRPGRGRWQQQQRHLPHQAEPPRAKTGRGVAAPPAATLSGGKRAAAAAAATAAVGCWGMLAAVKEQGFLYQQRQSVQAEEKEVRLLGSPLLPAPLRPSEAPSQTASRRTSNFYQVPVPSSSSLLGICG